MTTVYFHLCGALVAWLGFLLAVLALIALTDEVFKRLATRFGVWSAFWQFYYTRKQTKIRERESGEEPAAP